MELHITPNTIQIDDKAGKRIFTVPRKSSNIEIDAIILRLVTAVERAIAAQYKQKSARVSFTPNSMPGRVDVLVTQGGDAMVVENIDGRDLLESLQGALGVNTPQEEQEEQAKQWGPLGPRVSLGSQ